MLDALALNEVQHMLIKLHKSLDIAAASGEWLRTLSRTIAGKVYQGGTYGAASVHFSGTEGGRVYAGFQVKDSEGNIRETTEQKIIDVNGDAVVQVKATKTGAIPALAGTITQMLSGLAGVTSATNPSPAIVGLEPDTDNVIRRKTMLGAARRGESQRSSIEANVAVVAGVFDCLVSENYDDVTDSNNLNPHSVAVVVHGGDQSDIFAAMQYDVGAGVNTNSDNALLSDNRVVTNVDGKEIAYFNAIEVGVTIEVGVLSPLSAEQQAAVISTMTAYFDGTTTGIQPTWFNLDGFRVGENVNVHRLVTPISYVLTDAADSITSITVNGGGFVDIDNFSIAKFEAVNFI